MLLPVSERQTVAKEEKVMEKKQLDWSNLGFGYIQTDARFVSNYKNGAWDEGAVVTDANIVLNECAGVFQYAQTIFEGLKAYRGWTYRMLPPRLKCVKNGGFR